MVACHEGRLVKPTDLIPALCALYLLVLCGCGSPGEVVPVSSAGDDAAGGQEVSQPPATEGELVVLTYNVAGLPQDLSSGDPELHIPMISPLLSPYDLVLVQEDFWYHNQLVAEVDHPHQSVPFSEEPDYLNMGDGLNRFSHHPFDGHSRTPWPGCSGSLDCSSDCLATKGSSVARHTLAPGVEVDVYNLHMEAGGCPEDYEIRAASIQQLLDQMAERSEGFPVIMAGDWNLHPHDAQDLPQLHRLVEDGGLTDACWALECGDERIDRIFFRSSADVTMEAILWEVPPEFVDESGQPMSDHEPVSATLRWTLSGAP